MRKTYFPKLAAAIAVTALAAAPAAAQEATLNGASCFPIGSPVSKPWEAYVAEVNKRGKGIVQINLVGGAPAIGSPFTLVQRMAAGAYDITGCTEAYFGNVLPEAPVLRFAERTYAQLRANGGLDYMQKLLEAKNIHYIARHHDFGPFHLFLNKPIDKPDLTGLHLRVSPVYTAFFKSLGATVQTSNIAQVYTYMENGTVQGFGWPADGWPPAWIKVTKYRVEPGFYNSTLHTMANLKKWNSISAKARGILQTVGFDFEKRTEPDSPELLEKLRKQKEWTDGQGMQAITFTGADREKWLKAANNAGWAEVLERSPKHGPQLRKLFTK
jgi:TRAP-type C4-dicarboxylate transport system substrate-binding protein